MRQEELAEAANILDARLSIDIDAKQQIDIGRDHMGRPIARCEMTIGRARLPRRIMRAS